MTLREYLHATVLEDRSTERTCGCVRSFDSRVADRESSGTRLTLDAADCPGDGDLAASPACRATAIDALADRDAAVVRTVTGGRERAYQGDAAAILLAAGRFVERVAFHDSELADRARRDPLGAAHTATGRAGPVARIAAETGLAEATARFDGYEDAFRPRLGTTVSESRIEHEPPADAELLDTRELSTGATARRYRVADRRHYQLQPVEATLGPDPLATLSEAHEILAAGDVTGGERAPGRAVRAVAETDDPVETLTAVLRKHTRGLGVLEDLFADPRLSDVYATGPIRENPLRVTVDGGRHRTNVRLTRAGAEALSSRLRRVSGRSFSRANPTIDATLQGEEATVRVAGVTEPAGDGHGFAFRRHGSRPWTLPALVRNDTVAPDAAGLLSLAVERGRAVLLAGPRGAGKTTMLSALLWELPPDCRLVTVEDTPELPVEALADGDRDVQPLRTAVDDGPAPAPAAALRTALRLGDGALALGEVRGEEAQVLYEAMRVGDGDHAVLGTIHGSGGAAVRERVVVDLGVPESSFGATDLLVTLASDPHRVAQVEEVRSTVDGSVAFRTLYATRDGEPAATGDGEPAATGDGEPAATEGGELAATGALERGNSELLADLAGDEGSYATVLDSLDERAEMLGSLAASGRTAPEEIERARSDATAEPDSDRR